MITEITYYTDGSTAPGNPGPSGYGFYGTDNLGNIYTGYGPVGIIATNNMAELTATITALEKSLDVADGPNITILTDSKYVTMGAESLETYHKRNWKTASGDEIKNSNLWKKLHELVKTFKEQKRKVKFKWVKGHSGIFGNEKADSYADKGRMLNYYEGAEHHYSIQEHTDETSLEEIAADSVNLTVGKKVRVKKAPNAPKLNHMLACKKWYFRTNDEIMFDGLYVYVTSNYEMPLKKLEKRNKNLGKPNADTTISLLLSDTPINELDIIRARFNAECVDEQVPVVIDLNGLTKKAVWADLLENGTMFHTIKNHTCTSACNVHIGEILVRPLLVFKFEEDILRISQLLRNYRANSPQLIKKDITDMLVDTTIKGVQKITGAIAAGQRVLTIPKGTIYLDIENEIKLNVGIDIPSRNTISAMIKSAKAPIKIELLLFEVNVHSFRVATVITVDNCMVLIIAPESSLKFIRR